MKRMVTVACCPYTECKACGGAGFYIEPTADYDARGGAKPQELAEDPYTGGPFIENTKRRTVVVHK